MWFRRRRRQPRLDLSSLEASLDRLAALVEQLVALIPELAAARPGKPIAPSVEPRTEFEPDAWLLFVGGPNGYRLLERDGALPARGAGLELEGDRYVVLRMGPSPLPGDRRRCAFLEREIGNTGSLRWLHGDDPARADPAAGHRGPGDAEAAP